jgi:hypothetical protein
LLSANDLEFDCCGLLFRKSGVRISSATSPECRKIAAYTVRGITLPSDNRFPNEVRDA